MTAPEAPSPEVQEQERDEVFVQLYEHMRDNLGIGPQEDGAAPQDTKVAEATCANGTRVRVTVEIADED